MVPYRQPCFAAEALPPSVQPFLTDHAVAVIRLDAGKMDPKAVEAWVAPAVRFQWAPALVNGGVQSPVVWTWRPW